MDIGVGSFSVRFTHSVTSAPEPEPHGVAPWLRRHQTAILSPARGPGSGSGSRPPVQ
jgi:hypothetical protein